MNEAGARSSRKTRPDGVIEWRNNAGVIVKREFPGGQTEWYDAEGRVHRDDGPAVERPDGTMWFQHGKLHREDGPAVEGPTGKFWYRNDKLHRNDGPAIEYADGRTEWRRNDRRLKPEQIRAIMKRNGDKAAEPFLRGLDHDVKPFVPVKLRKR